MEAARREIREDADAREAIQRADELDELAEAEATGTADPPALSRARASRTSQVFSVRLPQEAGRILSERARQQGVSPGILLRAWAMDELLGDSGRNTLTFAEAQAEFRQALDRATAQALRDVTTAVAEATIE